MKAILLKRFYHARRSRKGFFSQILLPAIFVVLSMFVSLIRPPREGLPPLEMSPKMFGVPNYIVLNNRDVDQFSERFFKNLAKNPSSSIYFLYLFCIYILLSIYLKKKIKYYYLSFLRQVMVIKLIKNPFKILFVVEGKKEI